MRIKSGDSRDGDIRQLNELLVRDDIDQPTRSRIEETIRKVTAGARAQADAEYQIEFRARDSRTVATIHDLRIEFNGWVAQIDHLLINRLLEVWVCESKSFTQGVRITEQGHWLAYYGEQVRGVPSPIEQNKRHMKVLGDLFASGRVRLPRRFGFLVRPKLNGVVLLSNSAQLDLPTGTAAAGIEGLQTVIKSEQLHTWINKEMDKESSLSVLLSLVRVVSSDTLERVGRELVALNVPSKQDWAARFGLSATFRTPAPTDVGPTTQLATRHAAEGYANRARPHTATICALCGAGVSSGVADYCLKRRAQFGGATYCMSCQDVVTRGVRSSAQN